MAAGGFQQLASGHGKRNPVPPQSSVGGRLHRAHGHVSYKQLQESQEGWLDASQQLTDPSRGSAEPVLSPWFSRSQSQGSLSGSSPAQGGFMLATNISTGHHQLPHSTSSSSSLTPHLPSFSVSPSSSSVHGDNEAALPQLWGEVKGREEGGDGEVEREGEGGSAKWLLRPLWQDGWRTDGLVCSVPRLYQHLTPPPSHEEHNSLLPLLDHPRDSCGHNRVLHSADLRQHIRDVEQVSVMSGTNFRPLDLPPLPQKFWSSKVRKTPCDPLDAPPIPHALLNLDPSVVALLLRKSTAAICSHSGYHSTSLRALDTLAGVMGNFICRLSKQLCIHSDQQQDGGPTGFQMHIQDPLERSLWGCGVQGRAELHKFWKTEVEAGMQRLQKKAMKLHEEPVPSPLPPPPLARPLSLSSWPTQESEMGEKVDDEISLEEVLSNNMARVAPTTPDPGGIQMFLPDVTAQEPEGFILLTPDLPARKRLRTSSSVSE